MKIYLKYLIILISLICFEIPTFAYENIKSEIVRVGISNQNFSNYKHNGAEFISDGDILIKDVESGKTYNVKANSSVKIELKNGIFKVSENCIKGAEFNGLLTLNSDKKIALLNLNRKGTPAYYNGYFELKKVDDDTFNIINILRIQDYLKGVVPNEMPVTFNLEALKAQAVAARNYANRKINGNSNYDVCDSVQCQVYYGANSQREISDRAVDETKGLYALYQNEPIITPYFSTSIGITESWKNVFGAFGTKYPADLPYLVSVCDNDNIKPFKNESDYAEFLLSMPVSYDMKSPKYRWRVVFEGEELEKILEQTLFEQSGKSLVEPKFAKGQKVGKIKHIKVLKRGESGKAIFLEIVTDKGKWVVKRELAIRRIFKKDGKALNSANFFIEKTTQENELNTIFDNYKKDETYFIFTGGGFGHGVGMSQYGANFMAGEGKDFDDILKHYYTGIKLGTIPKILKYSATDKDFKITFYYDKKFSANLKVDNSKKLSNLHFFVNDSEFDIDLNVFHAKTLLFDITKYLKKGDNEIIFKPLNEADKNKNAKVWVEVVK